MTDEIQTKAVVSIAEMARMVGLSRARFYQLLGTTFPWPVYDVATRRPFYSQEQQQVCLDVRKKNCGIDGKPILFYTRRLDRDLSTTKPRASKSKAKTNDQFADIVAGLKALGMPSVTSADVQAAVKILFPTGTLGTDLGEVIRVIFLHFKRRDSGDNVGR